MKKMTLIMILTVFVFTLSGCSTKLLEKETEFESILEDNIKDSTKEEMKETVELIYNFVHTEFKSFQDDMSDAKQVHRELIGTNGQIEKDELVELYATETEFNYTTLVHLMLYRIYLEVDNFETESDTYKDYQGAVFSLYVNDDYFHYENDQGTVLDIKLDGEHLQFEYSKHAEEHKNLEVYDSKIGYYRINASNKQIIVQEYDFSTKEMKLFTMDDDFMTITLRDFNEGTSKSADFRLFEETYSAAFLLNNQEEVSLSSRDDNSIIIYYFPSLAGWDYVKGNSLYKGNEEVYTSQTYNFAQYDYTAHLYVVQDVIDPSLTDFNQVTEDLVYNGEHTYEELIDLHTKTKELGEQFGIVFDDKNDLGYHYLIEGKKYDTMEEVYNYFAKDIK